MPEFSSHSQAILRQEWQNSAQTPADWRVTNLDLTGENLAAGSWSSCELRESVLNEAVFANGRMYEHEFFRCDLNSANLRATDMQAVVIDACSLRRADVSHSRWDGLMLRRSVGHLMQGDGVRWKNVVVEDLEAQKPRFSDAVFQNCVFRVTRSDGITGMQRGALHRCLFLNCRFEGTVLLGMDIRQSVFVNCSFREQDWREQPRAGAFFWGGSGIAIQGESMDRKDMQQLRESLDVLKESTVRDALAQVLQDSDSSTMAAAAPNSLAHDLEQTDCFADMLRVVKQRFGYPELAKFRIEGADVWVKQGNRDIQLTSPVAAPGQRSDRKPASSVEPPPPAPSPQSAGGSSERFRNLEIE